MLGSFKRLADRSVMSTKQRPPFSIASNQAGPGRRGAEPSSHAASRNTLWIRHASSSGMKGLTR